jgi:Flp pilus assembly protein TadG
MLAKEFHNWINDRRGAAAVAFGIAALVLMVIVGSAIDFNRRQMLSSRAQGAVDSAALAIAIKPDTQTANTIKAKGIITLALPGTQLANLSVTTTATPSYRVVASILMPTTIMQIVGIKTMTIEVAAEAASATSGPVEIALALDNTGSMRNDMAALRAAAADFAKTLFGQSGGNVKMSVVPYVAAVNPGANTWPTWMIDTKGESQWHGNIMRWQWIAMQGGCVPVWGGGGGGSPPPAGSSSSGDRSEARDLFKFINGIARELFGVSSAHAQQVTPNTTLPLLADPTSPYAGLFIPKGFEIIPNGSSGNSSGCHFLGSKDIISHVDLLSRMPGGASWKGCVEARPSTYTLNAGGYGSGMPDYDVTDDPPVAGSPQSLFVPYFWPDEPDYYYGTAYNAPGPFPASGLGYHNNYLADGAPPAGWTYNEGTASAPYEDPAMRFHTIFKYNSVSTPYIREAGNADTYGPNASCPDPLLRLTSSAASVDAKINGLSFWTGGGTVISEGVMWAWRSLSPNLPFADGKPYATTNRKAIVLMTDGINGLADNAKDDLWGTVSDYSAYGYVSGGRQGPLTPKWEPTLTFDQMTSFLDDRTRAACTNAKAKGIEIFTVFFNRGSMTSAQQASSRNLLKDCATSGSYAFEATDAASLLSTFQRVSASLGKVRLVK